MSTPSLLNIPYLYKAGTLYSQIPESGAGDFTVSRTTTVANRSTRINKDGFIETVLDNVPRLDYPLGGAVNGCPALLVEPSAQNQMLQSQNLSLAFPSQANTTPSADVSISPDGTQNADRLTFVTTGGYRLRNFSIVSGTSYTATLFYKNVDFTTGNIFSFQVSDGVVAAMRVNINPVTNTITQAAGPFTNVSSSIENYGNGWYRVRISGTASNTGGGWYELVTNAAKSIDLWGFQFETGLVATSYIPTTTAAVTRSGEIITDTTAGALIGQTEGTLYAEVDVRNLGLSRSFMNVQDTSYATNAVRIESQGNNWRIHIRAASVTILDQTIGSPVFATGIYKVALAYSTTANGVAFAVNGTIIYTNASALTMPSGMDRVFIGTRSTASPAFDLFLNDRIRAVELHPNRLTNAQLATLTAL